MADDNPFGDLSTRGAACSETALESAARKRLRMIRANPAVCLYEGVCPRASARSSDARRDAPECDRPDVDSAEG